MAQTIFIIIISILVFDFLLERLLDYLNSTYWSNELPKELEGIYDAETKKPSQIDAYGAGYINKNLEKIVGIQTDKPLKRAIFPNGGVRMVEDGLNAYGYKLGFHLIF